MLTGLIRLKAMSNSLNLQHTDDANITYFLKKKIKYFITNKGNVVDWLTDELELGRAECVESYRTENKVKKLFVTSLAHFQQPLTRLQREKTPHMADIF